MMREDTWIRPYIKTYFWRFALIILLGVLALSASCMLLFTSGYLISKSALRPENILLVYVPIVGVRTFGIGRAVLHYVERLTGHDAVLRILSRMRVKLYRLLEPQALFFRSRYQTGDILGILAEDIENLQNVYIRTLFPAVTSIVLYVLLLSFAGSFSLGFALLAGLYMLLLIAVLPYVSYRLTRRKQRLLKQQRSGLYQKLTDAMMGMSDWIISGRVRSFESSYELEEQKVTKTEQSLKAWVRLRQVIGQMLVGIMVLISLYWAGNQYGEGHIPVTMIAAFVLVIFPLMDAFLPLSEAAEHIPQYQESLGRLQAISAGETRGDQWETDGRGAPYKYKEQNEPEVDQGISNWHQVELKLEKVTFSY